MATSDHAGNGRRAVPEGEDPAEAVPEADAAEQRTPAGDDDRDDWTLETSEEVFPQASEADFIEQARDASPDDDEHR